MLSLDTIYWISEYKRLAQSTAWYKSRSITKKATQINIEAISISIERKLNLIKEISKRYQFIGEKKENLEYFGGEVQTLNSTYYKHASCLGKHVWKLNLISLHSTNGDNLVVLDTDVASEYYRLWSALILALMWIKESRSPFHRIHFNFNSLPENRGGRNYHGNFSEISRTEKF